VAAGVHGIPMLKQYVDENDTIQNGFRLFLTARAGYHLPLFQGRLFLELSLAATN
jgi:hypothetical protein